MFDLDTCGIDSANYYQENYGFDPIFLGEKYNKKDPTDLIYAIQLKAFLNIFNEAYKCF